MALGGGDRGGGSSQSAATTTTRRRQSSQSQYASSSAYDGATQDMLEAKTSEQPNHLLVRNGAAGIASAMFAVEIVTMAAVILM